jgi:hypothetical protein
MMTTTSFYKEPKYDAYDEEREHDDIMTAEDYERREYYRNNWDQQKYDQQRY